MKERFQADIGANIRDFQRKLKQVDAQIRKSASGADVQISANIRNFLAKVAAIDAKKKEIQRGDTEVTITAAIRGFMRGAALVRAQAMALGKKRIVIPIRAALGNYKNVMGQIANFSRNIGEVASVMGRGGLMFLSPAAVPVIASAIGLLGQLGPVIGTVAGSTFALVSAFGTAGIGAAAFAAIAITNLRALFDENAKLNKEQQKGLDALNGFKKVWSDIAGSFESETLSIFTQGLNTMSTVLTTLKPMFAGVMTAAQGLMTSLSQSINAAPMQAFFDYLNTTAGPMFETITKSVGNFMQGLFSMMTAFGPLATDTANGFLKMSEGFAAWAANLSKSEKFQAFVDYVKENMPKVRSIVGDAIKGLTDLFAGFGPSASDMLTSLQDMMARFREWSSTISENKGFQNFIDYIKENGPTVVSTIGEIVTFIKNLGVALAPMGEKILGMVNSFTSWSNKMMEAHPWFGKIAAGALVLVGAIIALSPVIFLAKALFGGLTLSMIKLIAKITWTATMWTAKWLFMGTKALFHAARMAAAWFIALGPIGWVIAAVIGLAIIIIANWDKIVAWTKKAWSATWSWIKDTWGKIKTTTVAVATALWNIVKDKFTQIKEAAVSKTLEMANKVMSKISLLKLQALKKWIELKTETLRKVDEMKEKVADLFEKTKEKIKQKMTDAVNLVKEKVGEMPGKVLDFVGDMLSAGGDLVSGLIDGIKGMGTSAINAITGVVDGVVGKAKSLLKIKSPSRVFREMGQYVSEGLAIGVQRKSRMAVDNVARMANSMSSAFNPQLAMADMRASAQLDTSISRADMGVVRKSFAAEIDPVEVYQGDTVLQIDKREFARWTADDIKKEMDRNEYQRNASRRGTN